MDGGRRAAGQLLVDDGPDQRGEVRLRRAGELRRPGLVEQPGDDRIPLGQDRRRRRVGHLTGSLVRHVVTFSVPIGSPSPELRRVTSDGVPQSDPYQRRGCPVSRATTSKSWSWTPGPDDRLDDQLPTVKLVVSSAVESPPAKTSIVVMSIIHARV